MSGGIPPVRHEAPNPPAQNTSCCRSSCCRLIGAWISDFFLSRINVQATVYTVPVHPVYVSAASSMNLSSGATTRITVIGEEEEDKTVTDEKDDGDGSPASVIFHAFAFPAGAIAAVQATQQTSSIDIE